MNYRHVFHAGNFADVLKHALMLEALGLLTDDPAPLQVLDTHAGAGLYDLEDARAQRSREAQAGVVRLMDDPDPPPALARLKAAVSAANPAGGLRWYPGSPSLAIDALRPGDAWTGCELRPEEARALRDGVGAPAGVRITVREGDGYATAAAAPVAAAATARRFVLIDPPFERADEADRIVATLGRLVRDPHACAMVWLPLKDLDSFDRLLSRVEALSPPSSLVVQARLRPLADPMRMNGAALLIVGGGLAGALEAPAQEVAAWVAAQSLSTGSSPTGGRAVVERFGG